MKKFLSSLLVAAMAFTLAGCSGSKSSGGLKTFNDYQTQSNEMETFNYLVSASSVDLNVLPNCVDGLLENDTNGGVKECLAEKWDHNDDTTEWTFTLRDGLKWYDSKGEEVADLTAEDFVTALKWILTDSNGSNNTSMPREMIKGAAEYNDATIAGADQATLDELWKNVGVEAVDEKTVKYTMVAPKPYFDTATTYAAFYPAPTDFITEKGENFGVKGDMDSILYCGAYTLTEFTDGASKTLTKNPKYWDAKNVPFDTVNITMIESKEKAYQLYLTGELDYARLTIADLKTESDAGNKNLVETRRGQHVYTIFFNQTVNSELEGAGDWNKAAANTSFRQAWYYGIDFTKFIERNNSINPNKLTSNTLTASNLAATSDGKDYTTLVNEKMGYAGKNAENGSERLDATKAKEAKEKAISELTAQGVTFPVKAYFAYKSGDQSSEEAYLTMKQVIEDALGSDFVEVVGQPYIKSSTSEITNVNKMSITLSGWGADYGDPYNFLLQFTDLEGNFMNGRNMHSTDEKLNELVTKANEIVDLDERYAAFAEAEAYALENAIAIPVYYNGVEWEVTKVNEYSKPYAQYGCANRKYKGWETKTEAYTSEEYAEFEKAAK